VASAGGECVGGAAGGAGVADLRRALGHFRHMEDIRGGVLHRGAAAGRSVGGEREADEKRCGERGGDDGEEEGEIELHGRGKVGGWKVESLVGDSGRADRGVARSDEADEHEGGEGGGDEGGNGEGVEGHGREGVKVGW
jgi:hypothetical protein